MRIKRSLIIVALLAAGVFPAANAQISDPAAAVSTADAGTAAGSAAQKLTRRERFDRGLAFDTRTPSLPRGLWVAGIGGAYSQHDNRDYGVAILDALNSRGNTMTVSPMVHYVFANNQSIGVRFQYRHSLFDMSGAEFHLTPELSQMLFGEDGTLRYRYENSSYMGLVSYRYYIGLGRSRRFLLFNELQAGMGGGTGREDSGVTDAGGFSRSTHERSTDFRLGFSPGATAFVTNTMAVELQIGLLGYEFRRLTQQAATAATTPGEIGTPPRPGSRTTHNVSARFDLLSVAFGATFYL
ncbi:MAG: hypothetical protein LBU97_05640 [Alistipes sp.]|jgi:opacity protein-like surface antigen|nr:hypothetical protein [Alistipes sp.]